MPIDPTIRPLVRSLYDFQKLRMQAGLRLVAHFKSDLGQAPGDNEEALDKKSQKVLDDLRESYDKITEGSKKFPTLRQFIGTGLISTYAEFELCNVFFDILKNEKKQFDILGRALKGIPIYDTFMESVPGCGEAMSGVLLSEIDITKARYPSSIFAYAGLDVVRRWELVQKKGPDAWTPPDEPLHGGKTGMMVNGVLTVQFPEIAPGAFALYKEGAPSEGRGRYAHHLVKRTYVDKKGKEKERNSITYNPFLKTKLFVLAGSILKASLKYVPELDAKGEKVYRSDKGEVVKKGTPNCKCRTKDDNGDDMVDRERSGKYALLYIDHARRLRSHPRYGTHNDKVMEPCDWMAGGERAITGDARRHMQATRVMLKAFLLDLYVAWRTLENLPVSKPYGEEKLGLAG